MPEHTHTHTHTYTYWVESLIIFVLATNNLFLNNLTMNWFQSVVYFPLFRITSCHLSGSLLIPLKWNSVAFESRKFSTNVFAWSWENCFVIQSIEQKRWKSFDAKFGEYCGCGTTDQPKSNIFPAWFLLNSALRYHGKAQRFSHWWLTDVF